MSAVTIHKFGGAALADAAAIRRAVALLTAGAHERRPVVVVSALAGVTDALLEVFRLAASTSAVQASAAIGQVTDRHHRIVDELVAGERAAALHALVAEAHEDLASLVAFMGVSGSVSDRESDLAASRGERLAAHVFAAALEQQGVRARFVDACRVVATDGCFGHATPELDETTRRARATLRPLIAGGIIPVVPGFIGGGRHGGVVTLGRGGSDLTATLLGHALGARDVMLWKDVPGLLTADPRAVPDARVLTQLHFREAAEVAQYGARVLHPGTLVPVGPRTRVFVRPFADPSVAGTEISARTLDTRSPIKAIAATMDQALVTLAGRGLFARPGLIARAFAALDAAGVGAALISQAATEYAFAFTVPAAQALVAEATLRDALAREVASGEVESIAARLGIATVGVVGLQLADQPGVAARVFAVLADARINVLAAAQGSGSGGSLSLVMDATRAVEAQRAIHHAFQLHKRGGGRSTVAQHVDVVLLGAGTIGRELIAQLLDRRGNADGRLRVCGVIDRSGYVFEGGGLSRRRLAAIQLHKQQGLPLCAAREGVASGAVDAIEWISGHALSRPVLVDVTAADTHDVLERALNHGWDVVLANKIPLAAPLDATDRLHRLALEQGTRILYEATVGAGLPVIDTIRKLTDAGDTITRIEGCPSGTLGYLFGELGRGVSFSAAVSGAVAAGYAEPDPRVDLSGLDVARKALILGRLAGFAGDLEDVSVESLVPESMQDISRDEFMARLPELDAAWEARIRAARSTGRLLRYRARVTRRAVSVGLVEVTPQDPLGSLSGTDNQFAFTTGRYRQQPLVITGPGAGPAVTAAGVVTDLQSLAAAGRASALQAMAVRRAPKTRSPGYVATV